MTEELRETPRNPLQNAKRFLAMVAVATPMMGVPHPAVSQEKQEDPQVTLMRGIVQNAQNLSDLLRKMDQEETRELRHATELGSEVADAFVERKQALDLMVATKLRLQDLEHSVKEAQELEQSTSSIKPDLVQIFKQEHGVLPAVFIRQTPSVIEALKRQIATQEEKFRLAGDRYFYLRDAAEKKAK